MRSRGRAGDARVLARPQGTRKVPGITKRRDFEVHPGHRRRDRLRLELLSPDRQRRGRRSSTEHPRCAGEVGTGLLMHHPVAVVRRQRQSVHRHGDEGAGRAGTSPSLWSSRALRTAPIEFFGDSDPLLQKRQRNMSVNAGGGARRFFPGVRRRQARSPWGTVARNSAATVDANPDLVVQPATRSTRRRRSRGRSWIRDARLALWLSVHGVVLRGRCRVALLEYDAYGVHARSLALSLAARRSSTTVPLPPESSTTPPARRSSSTI